MPVKHQLQGQSFGRWSVISELGSRNGFVYWKCQCECGTIRDVMGVNLVKGTSLSCGCYSKEVATKHGMIGTPEYEAWDSMKQRVRPSYQDSHRYYDRGIGIDPRWDASFQEFYNDMGKKPDGMTLDRIDNDKGYSKDNCRWATVTTQARNKSTNLVITFNGKAQTAIEWAEELNINPITFYSRIRKGWTPERAITESSQDRALLIEFNGEKKTIKDWALFLGFDLHVIYQRLKKGWSHEKTLSTPVRYKSDSKKNKK